MDASDFQRLLGSPGAGLSALADAPRTVGLSALAVDPMGDATAALEARRRQQIEGAGYDPDKGLYDRYSEILGFLGPTIAERSRAAADAMRRGDMATYQKIATDLSMDFGSFLGSIQAAGGAIPYHLRPGVEPPTQHNPRGLPMDDASRMKRAREMGFTTEAYHGSNADIDAFSPSTTGSGAWAGAYGDARPANHEAVYLASNPKHAEAFGDAVYPLRVRARGFEKTRVEPEMRQWARENGFPSAQKMIDDYYDGQVYAAWDADERFADIARGLAATNAPGATVDFGKLLSEGQQLGSVHLVRDPTAIRSRFATFDPERADSSDLLASIAPWLAMLGGGAGLSALYLDGDEGGM